MGTQLNFFLSPTDTQRLEQACRELGPFLVLHSRALSPSPRVLPALESVEDGKVWLYYFLVREADLNRVLLREVPAQSYWAIDSLRSPVIEFSRCFFDGTQIRPGRLFFDEGFYGPKDAWVTKPADFLDWANSVKDAAKKLLSKAGNYYYGSEAAVWKREERVSFPSKGET